MTQFLGDDAIFHNTVWNQLGGFAHAVDFNTIADTQITLALPSANWLLEGVWIQNTGTTASLTTAKFGLFSAAGGAGSALVAGGTAMTQLTSNAVNPGGGLVSAAVIVAPNAGAWNFTTVFFRITTPQGAAASGNVYVTLHPLP